MWLSLVEHLIWVQGVAGSNLVIPIEKVFPSQLVFCIELLGVLTANYI